MPTADLLALRLGGMPIEEVGNLYEVAYSRVSPRNCMPRN